MLNLHHFNVREEDGTSYNICIQTKDDEDLTDNYKQPRNDSEIESYGFDPQAVLVEMVEVHEAIRMYVNYAVGAFRNLRNDHIEEVKLKFGLKVGGKTGIPFLAEASSEGNFEIEVICKFNQSDTRA
jgi:hypothetical protein